MDSIVYRTLVNLEHGCCVENVNTKCDKMYWLRTLSLTSNYSVFSLHRTSGNWGGGGGGSLKILDVPRRGEGKGL